MKKFQFNKTYINSLSESNEQSFVNGTRMSVLMESEFDNDHSKRKLLQSIKETASELNIAIENLVGHYDAAIELLSTEVTNEMCAHKGFMTDFMCEDLQLVDECYGGFVHKAVPSKSRIMIDREALNRFNDVLPKMSRRLKATRLSLENELETVTNKLIAADSISEDLVDQVNLAIEHVADVLDTLNCTTVDFIEEAYSKDSRERTLEDIINEQLL